LASFSAKLLFFLWLFIWVRWTLPRFRYDPLMGFGWKEILPLALANVFVTALVLYLI
jgi:NADH-quinone oxidoreductase subunit H